MEIMSELSLSGISYDSFDTIITLLKDTEIVFDDVDFWRSGYELDNNYLMDLVNKTGTQQVHDNAEAWLRIFFWLTSDIDELYRYSYSDRDEIVVFFKNLLEIFCSIDIYPGCKR